MTTHRVIVSGEFAGMRLDTFLAHRFFISLERPPLTGAWTDAGSASSGALALGTGERSADLSRSAVQKLIAKGRITVNGQRTKASVRLKLSDCIEIEWSPPENTHIESEPLFLPVLFEDEDLIVVNKPPGMVVHPAAGNYRGTLVNALLHHCPDLQGIGGERRTVIVHRLDKDTSGVMIAAKNETAFHRIALQFKERIVTKEYVAFVWGRVEPPKGIIDRPIGRHRGDRKRMSSVYALPRSRHAVTEWEVERSFCLDSLGEARSWVTLLRVRPRTGRTHQIRVHLADQGYPVIKDKVYGKKGLSLQDKEGLGVAGLVEFSRQALHAERLRLTHPRTGGTLDFEAPWFPDMRRLLEDLQQMDAKSFGGKD